MTALLAACLIVAAIGIRIAMPELHTWYAKLARPRFDSPTGLFTPIWLALDVLMALAAGLVLRGRSSKFRVDSLVLFYIQLSLSLFWIVSFFHLHRLLVAVIVLLGLWFATAFTIALFWRIRRVAGALMIPSLAWVSCAIAVNLFILKLN